MHLVISLLLIGCGLWSLVDSIFFLDAYELADEFAPLVFESGRRDFVPVEVEFTRRYFDKAPDRGIAWFERGLLHFHGHRTSFAISKRMVEFRVSGSFLTDYFQTGRIWVKDRWIGVNFSGPGFGLNERFRREFDEWLSLPTATEPEVYPPVEFNNEESAPRVRQVLPLRPVFATVSGFAPIGLAMLLRGKQDGWLFLMTPFLLTGIIFVLRPVIPRLAGRFMRGLDLTKPEVIEEFETKLRENPDLLDKWEFGDPPAGA
jgi:hypothetical protein